MKYYHKNKNSILQKRKEKKHYYNPIKKRLYYLKNKNKKNIKKEKPKEPIKPKVYDESFFTIDFGFS